MNGDITLKFADISELDSAIQRLADASGATVKEVLPSQMRLFAADLAFNTRPLGRTTASQKKGHELVEKRILQVYPSVGMMAEILASNGESAKGRFISYIKKKKYSSAAAMLNDTLSSNYSVGNFDGGKLHQEQQFSKRVNNRLVVIDHKKVTSYITAKKKLVGFAKGGFATAARQLGGVRGIPGFATRQNSPGTGSVTGDGKTLTITLTNQVKYIEHALDAHGEQRAIDHRNKMITELLKRIMTNKSRRASRSIK